MDNSADSGSQLRWPIYFETHALQTYIVSVNTNRYLVSGSLNNERKLLLIGLIGTTFANSLTS